MFIKSTMTTNMQFEYTVRIAKHRNKSINWHDIGNVQDGAYLSFSMFMQTLFYEGERLRDKWPHT